MLGKTNLDRLRDPVASWGEHDVAFAGRDEPLQSRGIINHAVSDRCTDIGRDLRDQIPRRIHRWIAAEADHEQNADNRGNGDGDQSTVTAVQHGNLLRTEL